jgi:nicotinamidase-related amidase
MGSHSTTALLLIDPYNDFMHPEGMVTPMLQASIDNNKAVDHIKAALAAARGSNISIFYGLHQQWRPGMYNGWKHMTGSNIKQETTHFFTEGSFGAQIYEGLEPSAEHNDVIVSKHWNSK